MLDDLDDLFIIYDQAYNTIQGKIWLEVSIKGKII